MLNATDRVDAKVVEQLFPLVYDELKVIARQHRARTGRPSDGTTSIVHEAYLRLSQRKDVQWESRAQFFYLASLVMRHLLVDRARRASRDKRGGGVRHETLGDVASDAAPLTTDLLDLDTALDELGQLNARATQVAICRFFGGLGVEETAESLDISTATVKRDWRFARAWLFDRIQGTEEPA